YEARRLCPNGIFLRGSMKKYSRESKRIFEIFARYSPRVQGLSLDEAFLDLSGSERLLGPPRSVGERLRAEVRTQTGLAVSVGIAPVKLVAKIASGLAKPDGLLEVKREQVREFLDPLPVGRIWGVGPVAEARLAQLGIRKVADIARLDARRLAELLGDWGVAIGRLARGEEHSEVEPYRDPHSYSEESTFARDVSDRALLRSAIITHAEAVARRLRADRFRARTVLLKLTLAQRRTAGSRGYPTRSWRVTLPEATDDGETIQRAAAQLLARSGVTVPVRLLGVGVANIVRNAPGQLSLFEPHERLARRERLNAALDEISRRFGSASVTRGDRAGSARAGLSTQIKRGDVDAD
ncbi:MAG TPA: DNA polymerase IV, partial [Myxococcota bacterium]|nr:DNA polymerase IV [Myxococcota bacterium]